jgi:hypothetical protein
MDPRNIDYLADPRGLDDSMLGGEEDDDLDALVRSVVGQVDGPPPHREVEEGAQRDPPPVSTRVGGPSTVAGGGDVWATLLAEQADTNRRQQEMQQQLMTMLTVREAAKIAEEDGGGKRKSREDISYQPQEPVHFLDEAYKIDDDGHDKVDTMLRQRLRQINADPKVYWKKGSFKQVDRPILGASLYLEHIRPGSVAESTICKHYDRCAHVEIKNYLTKNSGVASEARKKIKVQEIGTDEFAMGVQTQWEAATTVWEVMDAAFNFVAVEFMVRPYSFTGLAMLSCLHDCRYFCGVAASPKQQRSLIEGFLNEVFKKNKARGREGKPPLNFEECGDVATKVMAANKVRLAGLWKFTVSFHR